MSTSLAAVFSGAPGELELREISRPEPGEGEVLVRILGCTICGSDLHTFDGRRQAPVPSVLGHEIVGEIVAFGAAAPRVDMAGQRLETGGRITWSLVASCGTCFYCLRRLPQKCLQAVKYGHEAMRPGRELVGGFAEHCLLAPGTSIVRLPEELPLEVACPANCATATAAAAVEAAGEMRGGVVCVLGAGLLGLTVSAMARAAGAAEIICVEIDPARRERAGLFGGTHSISPEELPQAMRHATNGHGVDVVFELSGSTAAFAAAWPVVRMGGRIVAVGAVFPGDPFALALEQLVRRQLVLCGIHNYAPRHLLAAIQFLRQHQATFPFKDLVTGWYPLLEAKCAFQNAHDLRSVRVGVRS